MVEATVQAAADKVITVRGAAGKQESAEQAAAEIDTASKAAAEAEKATARKATHEKDAAEDVSAFPGRQQGATLITRGLDSTLGRPPEDRSEVSPKVCEKWADVELCVISGYSTDILSDSSLDLGARGGSDHASDGSGGTELDAPKASSCYRRPRR